MWMMRTGMTVVLGLLMSGISLAQNGSPPLGVGIVRPGLTAGETLYFYGVPGLDRMPDEEVPFDSLVFVQGEHNVDIAYAPPWFMPELLKLDYDILYMRAQTLTRRWIEVVVNRQTGETRWIDRSAVTFTDWSGFLLDVVAVEVVDPEANPVRSGPDTITAVLSTAKGPLRPLAVSGSWMQVSTSGLADRIVPTGWIRWRDGDRLLITWSPLS